MKYTPYAIFGLFVIVILMTINITSTQAQTVTVDNGDFKIIYGPNPNSPYTITNAEWLQNTHLIDDEVKWLNENFNLPYDVIIYAQECGAENAYYYPLEKKIVICYELIDDLDRIQYTYNLDMFFTQDVTYFILYHEIAHAILDIYDLPFSGNEETVADQFATMLTAVIQTDLHPNLGHDMLYNTQYFFLYLDSGADYTSTHDTDLKRFSNIACWSYGSDPVYNNYLLFDGSLTLEKSRSCPEQYYQITRYWEYILADHVPFETFFKPQSEPPPTPPTPPTPDTTPPIIVLIGFNNTDITQGVTYKDEGAICFDKNDGIITTITSNATNINTTNTGMQTIAYTCTDNAGNTETETRTIVINTPPPTPPPQSDLETPPVNMKTDPTPFDQAYVDNALKQQRIILQAEYNMTLNTLQEKYDALQKAYDTLNATITEINRIVNLIITLYS